MTHQLAVDNRNNQPFARGPRTPEPFRLSSVPISPFLQKKSACACGGGCPACQAKSSLNVSQPNDPAEIEADQMADRVMRKDAVAVAPPRANAAITSDNLLNSAGRPLDQSTRSFFEPRFGADFGRVRIHTGTQAELATAAVRARAFTIGHDMVFAAGQHKPETDAGKRLMAHELAHTLQSGDQVIRRSPISDEIKDVWDATPTLYALLARLSQSDVQSAQSDTDIDSLITTLLASSPNDLWLAQRIRQGRLGTTARARPIEVHFVQGRTNRKALVIAGVHGSEQQGIEVARMLLADLSTMQPAFTVIVVPTLFPDNAAARTREGATPTNRNFQPASEDLAAATAAGGGTAVDASKVRGARRRAILPENVMLLQLIERFGPEKIISIHGTRYPGAGGVFYDPSEVTPTLDAIARRDAAAMAYMSVPVEQQSTFEGQERLRELEARYYPSALQALVHRDRAPALAAAAQIDAATASITGRDRRSMAREGESTISAAERARRRTHPSVAGNVGSSGNLDTAYWSGSTPGGVSLGGYASQRGISIYTVEPPINLESARYPTSRDADVDAAERRLELQAYADAIRTVLLGI